MNEPSEEKKAEPVEEEQVQKSWKDKLKETFGISTQRGKVLLSALIVGTATIIFTTVVSLTISPDTFTNEAKRMAWIVRTIRTVAITAFGTVIGEQMCLDRMMSMYNGKYQMAKRSFESMRLQMLKWFPYFGEWFLEYMSKELVRKETTYLISKSIAKADLIMKYISEIKPEELKDHACRMRDGTEICQVTEYQAECIAWVQGGHIKIDSYNASYYMAKDDASPDVSVLEVAKLMDNYERKDIWFNRIYRIAKSLVFSTILAMFSAKDFMNASDAEAWFYLVTSIATLVITFSSGWISANKTIDTRVTKLNSKTVVLTNFNADMSQGRYKPESYEEKARKEYEEYERRKKEEADGSGQTDDALPLAESDSRQSDGEELVSGENKALSVEAK